MSDLYERVSSQSDFFKRILSKIPGFKGYVERQERRSADQLLRQSIAQRYEEQWQRISSLQRDLISQGGIAYIDDLEGAAIKIRQFTDRVRTASYGYAGFFDAVKVNEEELSSIYQYDLAMLDMVDGIARAIDNIEASIGTDGLPAAIRHLTSLARQSIETFDRRSEVILSGASASTTIQAPPPEPTPPAAPTTNQ